MTPEQRLLALDAAAAKAEDVQDPNLRAAISLLQDELEAYYDRVGRVEPFGEWVKQQQAACRLLAEDKPLFGWA